MLDSDYVLELLQENGFVTKEQVDEGWKKVADSDGELDILDALKAMRYVDEQEIINMLAQQYGLETIDLSAFVIPDEVIAELPAETARQYQVVPVMLHDDILTVAMSDPTDMETVDTLRYILKRDVEAVIAPIKQIQKMFGLPQTSTADATTLYYVYTFESHLGNPYNVQGYYSATNWLMFINTTTNRCYVYNGSRWNWSLVYNWGCSTGQAHTPTVLGEFTIDFRGFTFTDGVNYSCYYYTSFYGPYYMHSTLYKPYTWTPDDPRLGLNLSHGCVRLDTDNAYWVYNNIPWGTKVVVVR